ncbi:MAG: hypothetical protein V1739_09165 [Candidatus Omnitrophota bacterium]
MKIKKEILLGVLLIIFITNGLSLASDDIFDQINNGLEKTKMAEEHKPYLGNLVNALVDSKNYILYKEIYLSGRYAFELGQAEGKNSAGFILFGTFSGPDGQIGDMNVQFRTTYYNDQFAFGQEMNREYTEKSNDWEVEFHNAYLRLRALPPMVNVRIGHFYVPYGIQPWIDTHGTLLQSPAMEFSGIDRDWGVALEGQNDKLEYQLGLTRGSGMEYFERENSFALAGKLSTPRIGEHLNDWLGVSFLVGRIFDPMAVERLRSFDMEEKEEKFMGNVIKRWRAGIDAQKIAGPARLRFEISSGVDAGKENVLGEFLEAKYALGKSNRWSTLVQFENLTQDLNHSRQDSDTTIRWGLIYGFSANYNLQFAVSRDLDTIFGKEDTWVGILFYGQKGGLFSW